MGAMPRALSTALTFAKPTAIKGVAALVPTTGDQGNCAATQTAGVPLATHDWVTVPVTVQSARISIRPVDAAETTSPVVFA
ncbi:unannotated protein [freshwater metagenome]|uniref:Unannotated protein n=1 Tax=freshwater metagenome TaxID=449393 RepID=A0A6J6MM46_9ZZZZ